MGIDTHGDNAERPFREAPLPWSTPFALHTYMRQSRTVPAGCRTYGNAARIFAAHRPVASAGAEQRERAGRCPSVGRGTRSDARRRELAITIGDLPQTGAKDGERSGAAGGKPPVRRLGWPGGAVRGDNRRCRDRRSPRSPPRTPPNGAGTPHGRGCWTGAPPPTAHAAWRTRRAPRTSSATRRPG